MKEADCKNPDMSDGAKIPHVPGKGLKEPGIQGASLSDKKAGKFEDMMSHTPPPKSPEPKLKSNTTPTGDSVMKRKGGPFNPAMRPGGSFEKRSSAMQRDGEFNPEKLAFTPTAPVPQSPKPKINAYETIKRVNADQMAKARADAAQKHTAKGNS